MRFWLLFISTCLTAERAARSAVFDVHVRRRVRAYRAGHLAGSWRGRGFPLNKSLRFLYSVILTEYVRMDRGCLSVCLCVCVSVCLCPLYSLNGWADFDEILHK